MTRPGQDRRLVALVACTLVGAVAIRTAWMADDAFLTFRVADNFVHGFGLRWNVAERVQVFTHPAWLALVSAFYAITHEAYFTVLAVSIAFAIAVMYLLVTRLAVDTPSAVGAAAVLVLSKAFVDYTTSGFETPLTYALIAGFWTVYFGVPHARALRLWLPLSVALLVLTDAAAAVLVIPALAVAIWRTRAQGVWRPIVIALAPILVWEAFAFFYYGALLPNPTIARLYAGLSPSERTRHGIVYLLDSINLDPLTLTVVGAATALALAGTARGTRVIALGLVLYLLVVIRMGGDAMTGRLLAPALLCAAVVVSRVDTDALTPAMRVQALAAIVGLELMSPRPITHVRRYADSPQRYVSDLTGIVDERHLSSLSTALVNLRRNVPWPTEDGVPGGRTPRESEPRVVVSDRPGLQGFFGGPSLHLIHTGAATDPVLARLPAKPASQVGVERRPIPDGYVKVLAGAPASFTDPTVALLYSRAMAATRDPIWSWRRFRRLVQINFGRGGLEAPR